MVKLPVAGRVKTRLVRDVGIAEATRFYRTAVRAVLARLGNRPFWETIVAVSPDTGTQSTMLPARARRMPQGGGDLGERMQRPMRTLPPGPVCVIGSDIPAIRIADVRRAFGLLGRCDAVFGPAEDGGFWLVGLRRRPCLFHPYSGVRWSRSDTLAAVLANLERRTVGLTTRLADVDTQSDLDATHGNFGRLVRPGDH